MTSKTKSTNIKQKAPLTPAQMEKIFLTPCRTRAELKNFIKYFFELDLPDQTVSRYADTNPLDVIWECYDICVNKHNPRGVQELLYVAARGSGKTLGMAIAELLILLHDHRDVVHLGAILGQAKRCYNYQQKFLLNSKMKPILMPPDRHDADRILEKTNMEKSVFNIGGEKVSIEVLPVTLKACLTSSSKVIDHLGEMIPICDVKQGDSLLSPSGLVKVLDNTPDYQECLRIELDDGRIIEGTLDHKVWTQRGWVELQNLTDQDEVEVFAHIKTNRV